MNALYRPLYWTLALLFCAIAPMVAPDPAHGAVTFAPFANYSAGMTPTRVLFGSFTGSRPSMAAIRDASDQVYIFQNDGAGGFVIGNAYPTGTAPKDLVSHDFDGDGHLDLATANNGDSTVTILPGFGDNTFGTATAIADPGNKINSPLLLVKGDFNNDGIMDLAVVNDLSGGGAETVSIFGGNGDGTFTYRAGIVAGFVPAAAIAIDLNLDGKADLVLVNRSGDSLDAWLAGSGWSFSAGGTAATGTAPQGVVSGLFNGDSYPDLAVVNNGSDTVTILPGLGNGSFGSAASPLTTGSLPAAIVTGDFNQDGFPDLAVTTSGDDTVSLFMGAGSLAFYPKSDFAVGAGPAGIAVADANDDGKPDLATAAHGATGISFLLNTSVPWTDFSPAPYDFGEVLHNGSSATTEMAVINTGDAPMAISALAITGSDSTLFTVTSGGTAPCPTPPFTLATGASCSVMVTFTPTSKGPKVAALTVTSDAGNSPASADLSGSGLDYLLTLTLSGTGGAVVASSSSGSVYCGSSCAIPYFVSGATVQITTWPGADYIYSWSGCTGGGCINHSGGPWITMTQDRDLTVTFSYVFPARLDTAPPAHTSLQTAYNAAADGGAVSARSVTFTENLACDRNIAFAFQGGYGGNTTGYDAVTGTTTLAGSLSISSGTVTLAGLTIRP